jgi:hypothetical protein
MYAPQLAHRPTSSAASSESESRLSSASGWTTQPKGTPASLLTDGQSGKHETVGAIIDFWSILTREVLAWVWGATPP